MLFYTFKLLFYAMKFCYFTLVSFVVYGRLFFNRSPITLKFGAEKFRERESRETSSGIVVVVVEV